MELIGFILVAVIGYSIYQNVRRGDVTQEEKEINPTLIESIGKGIESANKYSAQLELKTRLETENFLWFRTFDRVVLNALKHAEFMEGVEEELSGDAEFRRLFEESLAELNDKERKADRTSKHGVPDQSWYCEKLPQEPKQEPDPEVDYWLKELYTRHLEAHHQLVRQTKAKLSKSSLLDNFFRQTLSEVGLAKLYDDFFASEAVSNTNLPSDSSPKSSKLYFTSNIPTFNDISGLNNLPIESAVQEKSQDRKPTPQIRGGANEVLNSCSGHIVEPPLNELDRLPTPLEIGERKVLEFFLECLSSDWEIYIQPHLNGLRPDFVLLNPLVGIGVFEVKNWNFESVTYFPKMVQKGRFELWGEKSGKEFSKEIDNPFRKISLYKQEIYNIYCPRLQRNRGFAAITGGVIFPSASTAQVRRLQEKFLSDGASGTSSTYLPVSGLDVLLAKDLETVFPDAVRQHSSIMNPVICEDLRGWLVEPDFSKTQREPLPLDGKQRRLAESRTASGFRRIKGPAGSGKSLVLAARAARLASEGKSVIVITFNITLWHYLRDMIRRDISHPDHMRNVQFRHFHQWCREVCLMAGFGSEYTALFEKVRNLEASRRKDKEAKKTLSADLEEIMDIGVPNLAVAATLSDSAPRYDAIFIDEAQDYHPLWWSALKNCLKHGGEMILAADTTQDIYNKSSSWTEDAMTGAGFAGRWSHLEVSYRLPREVLEVTKDFAHRFLPSEKIDLATESQEMLRVEPCTLRWIQCSASAAQKHCVDAVLAMMRKTKGQTGLANADITFICNEVSFGKEVTDRLETYSGIRTVNTFETDKMDQSRSKMAFWMGDARIKATTLHSFKGWESRLLVVHVGSAYGDQSLASIYAALTRLKRSHLGSWLTVVCSAPELADYGASWSKYRRLSES